MKYTKEKQLEILNQCLDEIQNYFEDHYTEQYLTDDLEYIRESISDLQTELELQQTFAQQERNVILEKTHYGK